ncbi:MAG TPA: prephenate dehydratase [Clostridia bacterium]|nr:prephenate dehydratase [Clostridia bacterium]
MKQIGYLGPVGTFTHDAALIYTKGCKYRLIEFSSIQELILAVSGGEVDEAVVPMENSMEGTVNITVDMLIHEVDLNVAGELIIPICHCLMAKGGTKIADLTKVLSHPQALAQCRRYLDNLATGIKREVTESTAAAAMLVMESREPWAAVANYRAAHIYGLDILKEGIQDNNYNSTRFVVLSTNEAEMTGEDKTTLVFTVNHKPGGLFQALKIFADLNINLTKIESRPMRTLLGEYLFLVDLEGHASEDKIGIALNRLRKQCRFFKMLGSYPKIYP